MNIFWRSENENTILRYDPPIEVTENAQIKKYKDISTALARKKTELPPIDEENLEEVLNGMFPPREFELDGKKYVQYISMENATREELKLLDKHLDFKLKERQAR